jgi:hypothetical protein
MSAVWSAPAAAREAQLEGIAVAAMAIPINAVDAAEARSRRWCS